jgi:uncharacterized protein (TIGR02145 family)
MKNFIVLAGLTALMSGAALNAQVTIGYDKSPEPFSILELVSNSRGLRLPQMTTAQRQALVFTGHETEALGLQIFNTTTKCVETWNGTAWIATCVAPSDGNITTFTNVMYDFQHQTLEVYNIEGIVTTYKWLVSKDNSTYSDIANAPNSQYYTVPVDFAHNPALKDNNYSNTLYFKCKLSNSTGSFTTPAFEMLFINTKVSGQSSAYLNGYGTDPNGVKYIILNKGGGGTLNVALLNLGQSDNNDAGDLGDFYQWGRVADGHQHIVWKKGTNRIDSILPMIGGTNNTSQVIAFNYNNGTYPTYADASPAFHQVQSGTPHFGKFITSGNTGTTGYFQWYNPNHNTDPNDNYLWGQSTQHVTTNRNPAKNGNDPCPSYWKVPSTWLFWDIFNGNGSNPPVTFSGDWTSAFGGTGTNNNWVWRPAVNNAVGGAVITNTTYGARVFLPAAGYRTYNSGALGNLGYFGNYWSSTYYNLYYSYDLGFGSSRVTANDIDDYKAYGFSVRCVEY